VPCDRKLKPKQTLQQRAEEIRRVQQLVETGLLTKRIKPLIGKQGAITFTGITDEERDSVTDICIYRRLMATGSALARAEVARAEQLAGRTVDRRMIAQGTHSHDSGNTWHNHK
jgi:hypothetical protein